MPVNESYSALYSPHSNVWNVRAPYARYLELHKQLNNDYQLRQITLDRMKAELRKLPREQQVSQDMLKSLHGRPHRVAVRRYVQSARTVMDMLQDIERQYHESNKDTVQEVAALFEQFAVCWCCNMLLATLEVKHLLTPDQEALIVPIAKDGTTPRARALPNGRYEGGIRQIIAAFPEGRARLERVPRRKTNPQTRRPELPSSDWERGALRVVAFWKAVRDQIAHKAGTVDNRFLASWSRVWELLTQDLHGISSLKLHEEIPLRPCHVSASFTTHDLLAKGMRDVLIDYSKGLRGHVFSPGAFRGALKPEEMPASLPELITDGDWGYKNIKNARKAPVGVGKASA
jgi:hypothetical protein